MHIVKDDRAIRSARQLLVALRGAVQGNAKILGVIRQIDTELSTLDGLVVDGQWHPAPLQSFRAFAGMLSAASAAIRAKDFDLVLRHLKMAHSSVQGIKGSVRHLKSAVTAVEDEIVQSDRRAGGAL